MAKNIKNILKFFFVAPSNNFLQCNTSQKYAYIAKYHQKGVIYLILTSALIDLVDYFGITYINKVILSQ